MSDPTLTLAEIVELAGVELPGSAQPAGPALETTRIERMAAIAGCGPGDLVFAETPAALEAALRSDAALILTGLHTAGSVDARVLRVRDPRHAFALCARRLRDGRRGPAGVHPSASVEPSVQMGTGVRIGAGAVVERGVVLGDYVEIGSRAVVCEGVVLGDRVVVQAGAVLGSTGFGYVRDAGTGEYLLMPQQGRLVIEDDVEIGANTTIDRGALEETRIGRGTKIDNLVHIGHNCRIGRDVVIAAQVGISGSCVVESTLR